MLKRWVALTLAIVLIALPSTAMARGFGSHFSSRSGYSSSFNSSSRGFGFNSGSGHSSSGIFGSRPRSSSGLFGLRSRSSSSYGGYSRPMSGFHWGSFGLGMMLGSLFHPFGGYYGYGSMYGYHPFGLWHFILDIIVFLIVFRIIRWFFRR